MGLIAAQAGTDTRDGADTDTAPGLIAAHGGVGGVGGAASVTTPGLIDSQSGAATCGGAATEPGRITAHGGGRTDGSRASTTAPGLIAAQRGGTWAGPAVARARDSGTAQGDAASDGASGTAGRISDHGGGEIRGAICRTAARGLIAAHDGNACTRASTDGLIAAHGGGVIGDALERDGIFASEGLIAAHGGTTVPRVCARVSASSGATIVRDGDGGSSGGVGPTTHTNTATPDATVNQGPIVATRYHPHYQRHAFGAAVASTRVIACPGGPHEAQKREFRPGSRLHARMS